MFLLIDSWDRLQAVPGVLRARWGDCRFSGVPLLQQSGARGCSKPEALPGLATSLGLPHQCTFYWSLLGRLFLQWAGVLLVLLFPGGSLSRWLLLTGTTINWMHEIGSWGWARCTPHPWGCGALPLLEGPRLVLPFFLFLVSANSLEFGIPVALFLAKY